jgi:NAD(P)-dependent dehydrogenase (short-subunit alcohol dehydrogenase family)
MQRTVALVSGGASGLGLAAAKRIVASGGKVVLADRNQAGAATAESLGGSAVFALMDCTSEADVEAALTLAESFGCGPVNVALNTAGILHAGKTVSRKGAPHLLEAFGSVLQINVLGSFNVCRLAAARMASREAGVDGARGVIINTASIAAFDGQAGQVAYSASKGAIVGMTLPMARDLAPLGIRVVTIAPGVFETPMMDGAKEEVRAGLAAAIPFPKRFGRPDEFGDLGEAVIKNHYLNGEVIRLDGAVRMV